MKIYIDKRYECGCSGSMKCGKAVMLWQNINRAYELNGSNQSYQDRLREYNAHYDHAPVIGTTSTVIN